MNVQPTATSAVNDAMDESESPSRPWTTGCELLIRANTTRPAGTFAFRPALKRSVALAVADEAWSRAADYDAPRPSDPEATSIEEVATSAELVQLLSFPSDQIRLDALTALLQRPDSVPSPMLLGMLVAKGSAVGRAGCVISTDTLGAQVSNELMGRAEDRRLEPLVRSLVLEPGFQRVRSCSSWAAWFLRAQGAVERQGQERRERISEREARLEIEVSEALQRQRDERSERQATDDSRAMIWDSEKWTYNAHVEGVCRDSPQPPSQPSSWARWEGSRIGLPAQYRNPWVTGCRLVQDAPSKYPCSPKVTGLSLRTLGYLHQNPRVPQSFGIPVEC
ncbi:MAG: hypothetical protein QM784_39165 [Polyangiaceae bacterium]